VRAGAYSLRLSPQAQKGLPAPSYAYFVSELSGTVRDSIADRSVLAGAPGARLTARGARLTAQHSLSVTAFDWRVVWQPCCYCRQLLCGELSVVCGELVLVAVLLS
jgi:hypothetical protein